MARSTLIKASDMTTQLFEDNRLIDADELHRLIPFSKMHRWRLEKAGQFPRRIKLPGGRKNFWILREVLAWIEEQAAKRGTSTAAKQRDTGGE